jgi:hypothetical protein
MDRFARMIVLGRAYMIVPHSSAMPKPLMEKVIPATMISLNHFFICMMSARIINYRRKTTVIADKDRIRKRKAHRHAGMKFRSSRPAARQRHILYQGTDKSRSRCLTVKV